MHPHPKCIDPYPKCPLTLSATSPGILYQIVYSIFYHDRIIYAKWSYTICFRIVYFQSRSYNSCVTPKFSSFLLPIVWFLTVNTLLPNCFLNRHLLRNRIMSELYYNRIVIIPIFLLPFILLLNGIITSWYYYRMFVIRNSTTTKYIQYRMNYYWMTPLPISTITKVFHPRIVPIPNASITELRITELFYYGLLLPNVAHSVKRHLKL